MLTADCSLHPKPLYAPDIIIVFAGLSGISNPNCNVTTRPTSLPPRKEVEPVADLMSFQDVTTDKKKSNWNSENESASNHSASNSAYNKSINDVLSLYNTSTMPFPRGNANQLQSPYPPLGTFASNCSWQNESLLNRNSNMSLCGYQTYSQGDSSSSTKPYSLNFQPRAYANSFTSCTTFQQSHVSTIKTFDPTNSESSQSNNTSPFHGGSASYGTEASFAASYQFPRPSSLNQLQDLGKFSSSNSPPTTNKAFEPQPNYISKESPSLSSQSSMHDCILLST